MKEKESISEELTKNGFCIPDFFYKETEITELLKVIKNSGLIDTHFAIRQFFKVVPCAKKLIFTSTFKAFIQKHFGDDFFLIKAIYFDKPPSANWIVPWHQDLTIVTTHKKEIPGFIKWTKKNHQHYVQPSRDFLENIVTTRIHLDDCTKENGALKVIPSSHLNGVVRKLVYTKENSVLCEVKRGGLLLMKPLIFHASQRTENKLNRRVIHLEFTSTKLPADLEFAEKMKL